jgi:hypothetical protein
MSISLEIPSGLYMEKTYIFELFKNCRACAYLFESLENVKVALEVVSTHSSLSKDTIKSKNILLFIIGWQKEVWKASSFLSKFSC